VTRYRWVAARKAEGFPITAACKVAEVSTTAFDDCRRREAAGPTYAECVEAALAPLAASVATRRPARPSTSAMAIAGAGWMRRRPWPGVPSWSLAGTEDAAGVREVGIVVTVFTSRGLGQAGAPSRSRVASGLCADPRPGPA
jgi:hypothetical protein